LRAEGHRVGTFRPITLWPFPATALAQAAGAPNCAQVLVYELNAGQMVDDVRLAVNGAVPVHSVAGVSQDESGMRQGDLLGVDVIRARILDSMEKATR
jgi:2-oxoglutarate ferredoxin oxidoreductase subunit alpha